MQLSGILSFFASRKKRQFIQYSSEGLLSFVVILPRVLGMVDLMHMILDTRPLRWLFLCNVKNTWWAWGRG